MKVDLKKQIATYTAPAGAFEVVTVPPLQYLMLDGHGDPNTSQAYADALSTLYPVAYKLKFFSKTTLDMDYVVMPLEALWWAQDMTAFTAARDKSQWDWTVMNLVPHWITDDHVADVIAMLEQKGDAPSLDLIRLATLDEGLAVQTLHVGSYDDEAPVLARLHEEYLPANGLVATGRHHEIYLNDPRHTEADKLRTILRQPVAHT
ncbi:GyrI-like domain-containing protein [Microbacterium sp. zg.Y625]|uniref:GyrI-like domain-containing protein n=1 Tax=Microbacterium jiangjiandongii TaxID=3049071 RepID=UPI00214C6329|nr:MULTISPECIES: GyrI-like domain-containing protein [unclassified Microbacterium]MCR2793188.1 GyrI-like domain-containing protein [Microbacterium sp. zg.Y625]WIM25432.1 GyrI-like domain-containing protein [Microbacterium sp. zg-Y625]